MIDRFTADIIFIVIVLIITAILGFLVGYFSRKKQIEEPITDSKSDLDVIDPEIQELNEKNTELDDKNKLLGIQIKKLEDQNKDLSIELEICKKNLENQKKIEIKEDKLVFDAQAAKNVFDKKIIADDLKIIEGIGPKIESILKKNKIDSWYKLSNTAAEDVTTMMLRDGGERYRIHDPGTWAQQSALAFEGKWEELKKLQDELDGGK